MRILLSITKITTVSLLAFSLTTLPVSAFANSILLDLAKSQLPVGISQVLEFSGLSDLLFNAIKKAKQKDAAALPTKSFLSSAQFIVYWGGWMGMTYNLNNLPQKVTVVNLAFADIANNEVDTRVSGYITDVPKEDGRQLQPTYINWTQFKYNHPNTKTILSLGGSTFSAIWTQKLNPSTADIIAKNIAHVVNQTYPVYRSNFANAGDRLGNVTIDGIDLDVEAGGNRVSDAIADNVIQLTQSLKKYLNADKIITFTGFSVGADPIDQCTVPGSQHCGEDIKILLGAGSLFDWVNVMAYDAGREYANSKYQIALTNYANYLGKNKTVLGLDLQSQWGQRGNFQETPSELATKALWQKQNNYAGAMLWGVNITNTPDTEQTYVNAIAAKL